VEKDNPLERENVLPPADVLPTQVTKHVPVTTVVVFQCGQTGRNVINRVVTDSKEEIVIVLITKFNVTVNSKKHACVTLKHVKNGTIGHQSVNVKTLKDVVKECKCINVNAFLLNWKFQTIVILTLAVLPVHLVAKELIRNNNHVICPHAQHGHPGRIGLLVKVIKNQEQDTVPTVAPQELIVSEILQKNNHVGRVVGEEILILIQHGVVAKTLEIGVYGVLGALVQVVNNIDREGVMFTVVALVQLLSIKTVKQTVGVSTIQPFRIRCSVGADNISNAV
jgi:hypothetical protein